jgi:hypothetical protein
MTRELLDLTTSHASGEEAVYAIFCKYKGKAQAKPMDNEEKGDAYPNPKGCLMIFGGLVAYESKHR